MKLNTGNTNSSEYMRTARAFCALVFSLVEEDWRSEYSIRDDVDSVSGAADYHAYQALECLESVGLIVESINDGEWRRGRWLDTIDIEQYLTDAGEVFCSQEQNARVK